MCEPDGTAPQIDDGKEVITLDLDDETLAYLDHLSEVRGVSRDLIVEEILRTAITFEQARRDRLTQTKETQP